MVPRHSRELLDAQGSLNDNLIASHLDRHTRFPVEEVKGHRQTIIGYVNVKDLILALRMQPASTIACPIISPDPERTGTVSEWVAAALEREVRSDDVIEADGVRVVVRKVRRQQLQEASCSKAMRDLPPSSTRTDWSAA